MVENEDEQASMMKARYGYLSGLPILHLSELEELDDLMMRVDPRRFARELTAWETAHG